MGLLLVGVGRAEDVEEEGGGGGGGGREREGKQSQAFRVVNVRRQFFNLCSSSGCDIN